MSEVQKRFIDQLADFITSDPKIFKESNAPAMEPKTKPAPTKPSTPTRPKSPKPWQAPHPKVNPGPKANKPATKPAPTKPSTPTRPKSPKPWQAPHPKVNPGPKARKMEESRRGRHLSEAWDPDVNRYVRDTFKGMRGGGHQFSKHPIYAMYGDELAQKQFSETEPKYQERFGGNRNAMEGAGRAINAVMRIENRHRTELEELAVELVSNYLKWPKELFKAYLNRMPEGGHTEQLEPTDFELEELKVDLNLQNEVNKRITLNLLTQGHALHAMDSAHYLIERELNEIDPNLLRNYTDFSVGSRGAFYFTDIVKQLQNKAMRAYGKAGFTQIKAKDDNEENTGDTPNAEIVAYGITFPVLVQELIKGAMELMSKWQFSEMDPEMTRKVMHLADNPADEPLYFLVGPQVWKYFLKIVPQDHDLMEVLQNLYAKKPTALNAFFADLIESVHNDEPLEHLKDEIIEMMHKLEDEYGDDLFDQSDYDEIEGVDYDGDMDGDYGLDEPEEDF